MNARLVLQFAIACLPLTATAAELQYAASLGLGYSDNIRRQPSAGQGEGMANAALEVYATQKTRRLDASLSADVAYVDYFRHSYGAEFLGGIEANAALELLPERIKWVFVDRLGQNRRDLLAASTPQNRENVNYFASGPELSLRLGNTSRVHLGGRYTRIDYAASPFDNERTSGTLAIEHTLSSGSLLSANAGIEHARYDNVLAAGPAFDRRQAYAAYSLDRARTHLLIAAGANQVERAGVRNDGALLRFELQRTLGTRSRLHLALGRELTDAGSQFGQSGHGAVVTVDAQAVAQSTDLFTSDYGRAGFDIAGRVTRLGFSAAAYRERYLQAIDQDRDRSVAEVHGYRQLGARLAARAVLTYTRDEFLRIVGSSREWIEMAGCSWRIGRKLALEASLEHSDRSSELPGQAYRENRAWVNLRWGQDFVRGVGAFGNL